MSITIDTGKVVDAQISSLMDRTGKKTKKGVILQALDALDDKLDAREAAAALVKRLAAEPLDAEERKAKIAEGE